ncbi:MAG: AAA family ATPase [Oscillospiraceae bacterium]|nr:AAA family ATPase [Oscillospiraceae bacterium]
MDRILIVGSPGSGKTTLGRIMAEKLGIPLVHLDKLFWREGWVEAPRDEFDALLTAELKKDKWIIDGNFSRTLNMRLQRADTVIFLDYPSPVCLLRVLKRVAKNYGITRPDMGEGCPEKLDLEFLSYVWSFRSKERPVIVERLSAAKNVELITIRNKREYKEFMSRLKYKGP